MTDKLSVMEHNSTRVSENLTAEIVVKDHLIPEDPLSKFLEGRAIYGDDFLQDEIDAWFRDEAEGYANLGAKNSDTYEYQYHAMNRIHGFDRLPPSRKFGHALGFGSAYGDELLPIIERISQVTIVDPSSAFVRSEVGGKPATWVAPDPSGTLPFANELFDLITCFGVLHHIPNVSHVLREFHRVLAPGGFVLVREPIVSMGDWRQPRGGLTKRERGLPLSPFCESIKDAGFHIASMRLIGFAPMSNLLRRVGRTPYNSKVLTIADWTLAHLTSWNYRYHPRARSFVSLSRPTAIFAVLSKK
jgi:SAM-dependent methyltransferase